jgi:hypothetical protein
VTEIDVSDVWWEGESIDGDEEFLSNRVRSEL